MVYIPLQSYKGKGKLVSITYRKFGKKWLGGGVKNIFIWPKQF